MPIDYEKTEAYLAALSRHGDPVLERLEEEAEADPFPIVGPVVGRFCHLMARAIRARRVFELGSGYGYSTLWFAKAVHENGGGEVHHTVWHRGLHERARVNIAEAGFGSIVRCHFGEAVQILKDTPGSFDLIFSDIDKELYPGSWPAIREKLRIGGMLMVDNMLLGGSVYELECDGEGIQGVREFTRLLSEDPNFLFQIVPIRDGVICALKTG